MCILSKCCESDSAISDLLKWFLVPSLQCNPILISQSVLVKPKVGEKGWGAGLMYAHQFLNSFFYVPWDESACGLAHLWKSQHPPKSPSPSPSCVTGAVSLEISSLIKVKGCKAAAWWSLQTPAAGIIFPDCLPSPFSTVSACASRLSVPSLSSPRAPGVLTPTFDLPCQPHHSSPMPLICSPHCCNAHRTASSRAQQTKASPFFQNTQCHAQKMWPFSTGRALAPAYPLIIALLCFSSHATHGHAQPIFPASHFAHRIPGGSLNTAFTPHAHTI